MIHTIYLNSLSTSKYTKLNQFLFMFLYTSLSFVKNGWIELNLPENTVKFPYFIDSELQISYKNFVEYVHTSFFKIKIKGKYNLEKIKLVLYLHKYKHIRTYYTGNYLYLNTINKEYFFVKSSNILSKNINLKDIYEIL